MSFVINLFRVIMIAFMVVASRVWLPSPKRAKRLTSLLHKLGPTFIKLGQTLSVRPDIVGKEMADELANLQDKLPPFSGKKAKAIIKKQLGAPINEIFQSFDAKAIAAASVAQVHKATLLETGQEVAVKVIRPNVHRAFKRDLRLFYSVAHFLSLFKPLKRLKFVEVVDTLEESIRKELDLRIEAASASKLKENSKNDEWVHIPNVYWKYTSSSVLVIEWIHGTSINDTKALTEAGHDLKDITERLAIMFFNQSYRDGFFHADVHPGNLFVNKEGLIVPIDFGIMGRLDERTKMFVAEILRGFIKRDYDYVAAVHFKAGYVPANQSEQDFALACRAIGEPIMGLPVNQISVAKLLALLFKITEDFNMETQPQLLLFQKTMVLIEGLGQQLYPEVNMWQLAEPWIESWAAKEMSPKARLESNVKLISKELLEIPGYIKRFDAVLSGAEAYFDHIEQRRQKKICRFPWLGWVMVAGLTYLFFATS